MSAESALPEIKPSTRAPDWLAQVPFAHRGLYSVGQQPNSIESVGAASAAGYGVEIDIRMSRDQVPIVVHDRLLVTKSADRQAARRSVSTMGIDELRRHGVRQLTEVLAAAVDAPLMIEIKSRRPAGRNLEPAVAAAMRKYPGPWCVASFNPYCLDWFRAHVPSVPRVLTARMSRGRGISRVVGRRLERLGALDRVDPAAVSFELDGLPSPATDLWRQRGGLLIAWTAVGPLEVERARQLADNLIFEQARP